DYGQQAATLDIERAGAAPGPARDMLLHRFGEREDAVQLLHAGVHAQARSGVAPVAAAGLPACASWPQPSRSSSISLATSSSGFSSLRRLASASRRAT